MYQQLIYIANITTLFVIIYPFSTSLTVSISWLFILTQNKYVANKLARV